MNETKTNDTATAIMPTATVSKRTFGSESSSETDIESIISPGDDCIDAADPPRTNESPEYLRCEQFRHKTVITKRWRESSRQVLVFLGAFCCFWNGTLLILATAGGFQWWTFLFPHTWVGLVLIIEILRILFNSTIITISSSCVQVRVTPLSYSLCWNTQSYGLNDGTFERLRVAQKVIHDEEEKTDATWFFVQIMRTDGTLDEILTSENAEIAMFYKREIERFIEH